MLAQQAQEILDLTLDDQQIEQFEQYQHELLDWNTRMNLTRITEPDEVRVRHFLDSLSVSRAFPMHDGMEILDVGTGAGFPGLPLAIAFPDTFVLLMDATGKKIRFLEHIVQTLGLVNVEVVQGRAEELAKKGDYREQFDLVTARAMARLPALLEMTLPFARRNGIVVALKGQTAQEEADASRNALKVLNGKLEGIQTIELPDMERQHFLVIVKKMKGTPHDYPRGTGIPTRNPL